MAAFVDCQPLEFGFDEVPRSTLGFLLAVGLVEQIRHKGYSLALREDRGASLETLR
jgi:hypothetical protein